MPQSRWVRRVHVAANTRPGPELGGVLLASDRPARVQVWSALEQNQYCRAAQLYILARTTYSQLKSDPDKETRRLLKVSIHWRLGCTDA